MKITVMTVCFNSEKTIGRTIESVLRQTYADFEYLIIDGKSTDNTVAVAESYRKKFEERNIDFRIISEPDNGMWDALNKGISFANGEIIGSINSDDWYEPNALEVVNSEYNETHFNMFYADLRIIKPDNSVMIKKSKMTKLLTSRGWNHPTTFVTKETYKQYPYKTDCDYADLDLMVRIRKDKKNRIAIKNIVIANFVSGGISTDNRSFKNTLEMIKKRYHMYRDNEMSRLYFIDCCLIEFIKSIFYSKGVK